MADFIGANLLSSVQKKMFPNGVACEVQERLDNMMVFQEDAPNCVDAFSGNARNIASKAYTMFRAYDFNNVKELHSVCNQEGMKVKVDSVETKYIADAEQTGSLSVYTFTDRRGNKVSINNINVKEYLDQEQQAVDDILQGVVDEVIAGNIILPSDSGNESPQEAA